MVRCTVCKRTLSAQNSIARNIGPVCAKKSFKAMDEKSGEVDVCDIPWDPATEDVIFRREVTPRPDGGEDKRLHFNIGLVDDTVKQGGFEWGYGGTGPANFAYNILRWFGVSRKDAQTGGAYQEFKRQFIEGAPHEGGTIPGPKIREWIADNIKPVGVAQPYAQTQIAADEW